MNHVAVNYLQDPLWVLCAVLVIGAFHKVLTALECIAAMVGKWRRDRSDRALAEVLPDPVVYVAGSPPSHRADPEALRRAA